MNSLAKRARSCLTGASASAITGNERALESRLITGQSIYIMPQPALLQTQTDWQRGRIGELFKSDSHKLECKFA